MTSSIASNGPGKCAAWIVACAALLLAGAEGAEPPARVAPIQSLWFLSMAQLSGTSQADATLVQTLKQWRPTGVFDASLVLKLPPTFADPQGFSRRFNAMVNDGGMPLIVATLPVGTEGWESSGNQRLAQRKAAHYDANKALPQAPWLETFKDLHCDTWAWVLEQPARMPTPDEAARSASQFVRFAKSQHKKSVVWLSGQAITHGMGRMVERICQATRADADYFVWMDLPSESLEEGESQWRETLGHLLDKIVAISPKEKTVIQWSNHPQSPTRDVPGTVDYIRACQARGINRFCLLLPPHGILDQEPWQTFYRTLPKIKGAKN